MVVVGIVIAIVHNDHPSPLLPVSRQLCYCIVSFANGPFTNVF